MKSCLQCDFFSSYPNEYGEGLCRRTGYSTHRYHPVCQRVDIDVFETHDDLVALKSVTERYEREALTPKAIKQLVTELKIPLFKRLVRREKTGRRKNYVVQRHYIIFTSVDGAQLLADAVKKLLPENNVCEKMQPLPPGVIERNGLRYKKTARGWFRFEPMLSEWFKVNLDNFDIQI